MDKIINYKITKDERETFFFLFDDKVVCESTIPRDYNRCVRKGWSVISILKNPDGTIVGMTLEAPRNALSIRSVGVKKKAISGDDRQAFIDRMKSAKNSR